MKEIDLDDYDFVKSMVNQIDSDDSGVVLDKFSEERTREILNAEFSVKLQDKLLSEASNLLFEELDKKFSLGEIRVISKLLIEHSNQKEIERKLNLNKDKIVNALKNIEKKWPMPIQKRIDGFKNSTLEKLKKEHVDLVE